MTQRITVPFLNDMLKISLRNLRSNQNLKNLFPKIKFQEKRKICEKNVTNMHNNADNSVYRIMY